MTLEEKAALCTGDTAWTTTPVERLGLPAAVVSDGPHGLRRTPENTGLGQRSLPATCFPTASLQASTWNTALVRSVGEAIAEEALAMDVNVVLGPGVNMKRSPLCGRNFEYYSEDPFLAGQLAAALIQGIQSRGVGTSLKHYAANNQEFQRFSIDTRVDERTLREIYLTAFEIAVRQGQPWTVMCSYNKINGTYGSEHDFLLNQVLRGEWGFEGVVVSDWGAVHNRVAALKGGLDLEMPGPKPLRVQAVVDAVQAGTLDVAVLDRAVRRLLEMVAKGQGAQRTQGFDIEAHHALAARVAAEGIVLLKNDGILPLCGVERVAVIGRSAEQPHYQGGGSSHINPTKVAVPLEELRARLGQASITYCEGYPADAAARPDLIGEAVAQAAAAEVALLYIALPSYIESEGYDRQSLDLTEQQVALIKAVSAVQPRTVVILNNGAPVAMGEWIDGVAAVVEAYMMGQAGGVAIAEVLTGAVNPSGKLAETFPEALEDTPAYLNWPGEAGAVRYGEGLFIGYRYYDKKGARVLFPFGYGLSYTSFAYSNARVSADTFMDVDGVQVSVDVTNTGCVAGQEVVQLYVHDCQADLVRPEKELKGFAKVALEPGETRTVTITLDARAFSYWHPDHGRWIAEPGDFTLLVAASSVDVRACLPVTMQVSQPLPSVLDMESTMREWLADPQGKALLAPVLEEMAAASRRLFGEGDGSEGLGLNIMDMFVDTPLVSVLEFRAGALPKPPEAFVADLLQQIRR
ncbi:MAG: glycosyl hydrolase [Chloroflexi bacterium]|nr:glycosyl hydrolase [Chloroflexota bacterium]